LASKGLVFIPQGINVIRALTSNDIEVLKFLTKNLTKDFTILKIAKGVGKTNRLVYAAVKRLIKEKIIIVEEKAKLKLCRLNFEMPSYNSFNRINSLA
jgi:predicted transcriptional regulator